MQVFRQEIRLPKQESRVKKYIFLAAIEIFLYFCNLNQHTMAMKQRSEEDYYNESRRLRAETMLMADSLRDNPLRLG